MTALENHDAVDGAERPVLTPKLHHVNIKTTRKDQMIAWYQTVCGMHLVYDNPSGCFMTNDEANHRIALLAVPGLSTHERRFHDGLHHTAFEYENLPDLDSTYLRLREEGIKPVLCVNHRTTISYYYEDPDGNLVELQCDAFGDQILSTKWMVENLYDIVDYAGGVLLDPDLVSEDLLLGATLDDVRERSETGAYSRKDPEWDFRLPPLPPGATLFKP